MTAIFVVLFMEKLLWLLLDEEMDNIVFSMVLMMADYLVSAVLLIFLFKIAEIGFHP